MPDVKGIAAELWAVYHGGGVDPKHYADCGQNFRESFEESVARLMQPACKHRAAMVDRDGARWEQCSDGNWRCVWTQPSGPSTMPLEEIRTRYGPLTPVPDAPPASEPRRDNHIAHLKALREALVKEAWITSDEVKALEFFRAAIKVASLEKCDAVLNIIPF